MNTFKRLITGFFLTVVLSSFMAHAESSPLQVAFDDFPPYAFVENGEPTGYSVDVVKEVCKKLGVEVEFKLYPWQRAIVMAREGAVDALLNVSYQPERDSILQYTPGQKEYLDTGTVNDQLWQSEYVFFVNRIDAGRLDSVSYDEVASTELRVGVDRGFSYNKAFREASFKRVYHNNPQQSMQALLDRDIDLYACDRSVGLWLIRKMKAGDQVTFIPQTLFSKPYNIAFTRRAPHPEVPRLTSGFYSELNRFTQTHEHAKICEKYDIVCRVHNHPRDLIFVCESWKPFEYEEDGKVTGLDAEVVSRIMGRLGIPYQIRIYPWSRAWMMIEKGAADAVLSVSYKASREKVLYYTDEQRGLHDNGELPTDYLWLSEYVFFLKKQNLGKFNFKSYEKLQSDGIRVGTNKGYSYSPSFPTSRISSKQFNNTRDGFLALVNEEIDLYPIDRTVGLAELKDMGLEASVTYLPQVLFAKPYLAPFSRISDYPDIKKVMDRFNTELRRMRTSGEYGKIYREYCSGLKGEIK